MPAGIPAETSTPVVVPFRRTCALPRVCLPGSLLLSGAWRGQSLPVHGDHSNDEETRLGALSDHVRFDVLQGSWLHDALSLDHYPNNPLAPQYTAVPAAIPALALGVLGFGPDSPEREACV